jgi:hypothetical protein
VSDLPLDDPDDEHAAPTIVRMSSAMSAPIRRVLPLRISAPGRREVGTLTPARSARASCPVRQ